MSKAVLISIQPSWCDKIVKGRKTIEVRKTRPKLEPPFKCYIYCTKARKRLVGILRDGDENYGEIYHGKTAFIKTEKGSVCDMWGKRQEVIGEFVCDRIERIVRVGGEFEPAEYFVCDYEMRTKLIYGLISSACLKKDELEKYLDGGVGYGWHISNLKIYDTSRELSEFRRACKNDWYCESCAMYREHEGICGNASLQLRRPPQNWCYVAEL